MKKSEIIENIESGNYFYNDSDTETIEFWKEAVKKCPEFVTKDIYSLVEFTKQDDLYGEPEEFEFRKEYKDIFKPLNVNVKYYEE